MTKEDIDEILRHVNCREYSITSEALVEVLLESLQESWNKGDYSRVEMLIAKIKDIPCRLKDNVH